jgi:thiol-disulfide isomerase/thioredoxin
MKKLLLIFAVCLCAARPAAAQGIEFLDQPEWEQVLATARAQDKYIFMDCYTTWCGPCKALAAKVFVRPEVGEFFNAAFINVKYDMERGEGAELSERYRRFIVGFPTLLLIDGHGNVVHQMAGYQEPDALIEGMRAGAAGKSLSAMRERYEAGQRDRAFLGDYMAALNSAFLKDEIERVATDYMRSLPPDSLLTPENWALVGEHVKDPWSPQFEHVLRNMTGLVYKSGVDGYRLERQLSGALDRAVERLTDLETGSDGNVTPLKNEPEKVARLRALTLIANLKRAESQRAYLRVHELKLAAAWSEALDCLEHYSRIGAMGYGGRFVAASVHYIASMTTDRAVLRRCLAMMEELQRGEDGSARGADYHDIMAVIHQALGNDEQAAQSRAIYEEYRKKVEADWEAMIEKMEE